jgi:hypothetical protein
VSAVLNSTHDRSDAFDDEEHDRLPQFLLCAAATLFSSGIDLPQLNSPASALNY